MSFSKFLAVLASGALFGFGLALSTMVQPEVVLGFLRMQDWGLMLVMGGAVMVTVLAYQLAPRLLRRPMLGDHFSVRPAIAGLGTGNAAMLVALGGIALGAYAQGLLQTDS